MAPREPSLSGPEQLEDLDPLLESSRRSLSDFAQQPRGVVGRRRVHPAGADAQVAKPQLFLGINALARGIVENPQSRGWAFSSVCVEGVRYDSV